MRKIGISITPQQLIDMSDLIVVGEIKKKNYEDKHIQVFISVESVLQGKITEKEIVLNRDLNMIHDYTFDFPEKGTKIMVLLKKKYPNVGLSLTYANSICELKENKVTLYKGMDFRSKNKGHEVFWSPRDYEATYQAFYDNAVKGNISTDKAIQIALDYATKETNWKWKFASIELVDNDWIVWVRAVDHFEAMKIMINLRTGKIGAIQQTE
ncbi:hypothetical protein [Paenibacillus sp. GP183]|uniref:hypothetical protein n=1 Tax=Paenibacillus sp. GP183 TaxID=1882751 RepID=UPI0008963945|nr:hypothetical protein [Paenibacillus sp. GP183]SEB92737.1 hypothetical protein SAMN05443246_2380 [Paenibacillus sp. GP183]